jgi:hypothetical protein
MFGLASEKSSNSDSKVSDSQARWEGERPSIVGESPILVGASDTSSNSESEAIDLHASCEGERPSIVGDSPMFDIASDTSSNLDPAMFDSQARCEGERPSIVGESPILVGASGNFVTTPQPTVVNNCMNWKTQGNEPPDKETLARCHREIETLCTQ